MSETALNKPKRKNNADYKAIAAQQLVEMSRIEDQMDWSRSGSERLKAETQVIKAETEVIKARVSTTLSQLMQQINSLSMPM